jgi:hypothetical protein
VPAHGQRSLIQTPPFLKGAPNQTPLADPPAAIHLAAVGAFLEGLVEAAEFGLDGHCRQVTVAKGATLRCRVVTPGARRSLPGWLRESAR